ncbi:hypothetical protein Tco_1569849, partial [Tanacetum coccineum]
LDGEVGFADVARSGVDSSTLNHDEFLRVDDLDLDLNLNKPVNLNVSQVETQSKLLVSKEPDVGRTQEPILSEVFTQEPIVTEVSTQKPIMAEVSTEIPIVKEVRTQKFSVEDVVLEDYVSFEEDGEDAKQGIDTKYETEYDVQSSEDAGTDDDDDVDKYFLVDEENEIVEPDVDVHLFGISMDLPFDNIGVTDLVLDDVLEGEYVDVNNADGFDSDPGNDVEKNYRKRRLSELRTEMEGVINASGQWKYLFYSDQKFITSKEAKDRVYLHSIKSIRNLKLYKNDGVRIRARCDGKVPVFIMSQGTGQTGPNRGIEAGTSRSSGPTTRNKKRKNTVIMSSATSAVTYTSVYTDSEPGRAFWGADDEEISEGGIPRVIVLGYDGLPIQPVAPPSPDYIPGPEDPQTPPVPQDEDEHEFLAEERPLPPVDSPTAESPGHVTESDPEEDPEEYEDDETEDGPVDYPMDGGDDGDDDDGDSSRDDAVGEDEDEEDEDEEEEEDEHLAPADSTTIIPVDKPVFPPEGT